MMWITKELRSILMILIYQVDMLNKLRLLKSKLRSIKRELDRGISIEEIITDVIQPDIDDAPFVNYWEVGMCDGLIRHLNKMNL